MIAKKILPVLMTILMISTLGASAAANSTNFSTTQVGQSAGTVKNYVETNGSLPDNVTVGGQQVTTPQFLYLLTTSTQNVNSANTSPMNLKSVSKAPNPSESISSGTITKSEYLSIASTVNSFVNANGRLPNYVTTSLGKMGYESLVYTYSKIMVFYNTNGRLPNSVSVVPWSTIYKPPAPVVNNSTNNTNNNTGVKVSLSQIVQSAGSVKSNVETNYALPDPVNVGGQQVTPSQFLYLLSTATQNINGGVTSSIAIKNVLTPSNPSETITNGTITKTEYLSIASKINAYITANGGLPNYVTTSLGTMNYQSLIYMYSKILNFYSVNNRLPTTVSVKSWYGTTLGPAATMNGTASHTTTLLGKNTYGYVQKLGPFGTGQNKVAIIIGVHPQEEQAHIAMLNAIEYLASTLKNVQIWVYQVVVYDGSDYTTGRTNGQNLANQYVVPNIDSSYKLVLDAHGNRGNYYIGSQQIVNSIFAPSNGTASLNFANEVINYSNGNVKYYSIPDGTSLSSVTLPIAAKGIPTLVYEQYLNQANYAKVLFNNALQVVKATNAAFA